MTADSHHEIIKYYREAHIDYQLVWHLDSQNCMHYGLWKRGIKRLRDALQCTHETILEMVPINHLTSIIDLGCGVGGTSIYLNKKTRCSVHGVSISPQQIKKALENSNKLSVYSNCTFSCQDFCCTNFQNASFDIGIAIESSCYSINIKSFLDEANRILRKNGDLIIIDFFWTAKALTSGDKKLMRSWTKSWAIKDFKSESEMEKVSFSTGFHLIKKINYNKEITPSVKRLFYYFFPGLFCHLCLSLFGMRTKIQRENMLSTLYQYQTFKKGLWNYNLYHFKKSD